MKLPRPVTSAILRSLRLFGPRRRQVEGEFTPGRIAVMRFGGFGDVLAVTGLVRALRNEYPDARIDFITDPASRLVLDGNRDIDELVIAPKPVQSKFPVSLFRGIREMRRWSAPPYDMAFLTHHEFGILFLSLFFRARFRIGFDINDRGFDFAFTHSTCTYTADHARIAEHLSEHFTAHYQKLFHAFLGEARPVEPPRIELGDDEVDRARGFLSDNGLDRNLIVIAAGGTSWEKRWPMDRYAAVARELTARFDVSVMVMLGPEDAGFEALFAGIEGRFYFDAGGNSFRENIAITAQASAVIGNDTGMTHVAAAFDVPGVTLFGPTPSRVFGYAHRGHRILTAPLPCVPCNTSFCRLLTGDDREKAVPCLDDIPLSDVLTTVEAVFSEHGLA